ncbi:MAG: glycine cleavage T C-terminal barrel domain-containing protein [Actinomycetes bacterium]
MSTYRSVLLEIADAIAIDPELDPHDAGVAWHYGDPLREQRALEAGEGFVDLSHRGVIAVTGSERLSWLHSLISQHVEDLQPGQARQGLVLSPHGHVEHHFWLVDDGATTWIITEGDRRADLLAFLDSMRFMLDVAVADVTQEWALVWFPGRVGVADAVVVVTDRGSYALLARAKLNELAKTWGKPAGIWAFEALRIAAGEPRIGFETDHKTIAHEVGWIETAVHLNKGCYRGQETVARVHNLGKPPRRLVMLHLDGSTNAHLPKHGDDVELDGKVVGFVGSATHHHELGPIALAVIKRNIDVAADFVVDGVAASQEVLVSP